MRYACLIYYDPRILFGRAPEAAWVTAGHPLANIGSIEVRPVVDFSQPQPEL